MDYNIIKDFLTVGVIPLGYYLIKLNTRLTLLENEGHNNKDDFSKLYEMHSKLFDEIHSLKIEITKLSKDK